MVDPQSFFQKRTLFFRFHYILLLRVILMNEETKLSISGTNNLKMQINKKLLFLWSFYSQYKVCNKFSAQSCTTISVILYSNKGAAACSNYNSGGGEVPARQGSCSRIVLVFFNPTSQLRCADVTTFYMQLRNWLES